MIFWNCDGRVASFCGNGSRCAVLYFVTHCGGDSSAEITFAASDGEHVARVLPDNTVSVSLADLSIDDVKKLSDTTWLLDTGSPHVVVSSSVLVDDDNELQRLCKPLRLRHNANVNYVTNSSSSSGGGGCGDCVLRQRTFERGVEALTLACGSGAVASALCHMIQNPSVTRVRVQMDGGVVDVGARIDRAINCARSVTLVGPATFIFSGTIEI